MFRAVKILLLSVFLILPLLLLQGCGCGFDCNSDSDDNPATLNLGFSDAPLDDVSEVWLEVDRITFSRTGSDDVVVETFTISELGLTDAESFQLDLMSYQGINQLVVITGLELAVGTYSEIVLDVLDGDVNLSHVLENDGAQRELNVDSSQLVLPGMTVSSTDEGYTVEFSLGQSLVFNSSDDSYELTTNGIRVEQTETTAVLKGTIDPDLFDLVAPCDTKVDPEAGNRVYLYEGTNLAVVSLADVYTAASSITPPDAAIAPYTVMAPVENSLNGDWEYTFGYLPAGDYTLVFSCDAVDDDPIEYDGFRIPLPDDQLYEISLDEAESSRCDLATSASCS